MAVVRPDEDEVRVGQSGKHPDEQLQPLSCRDSADREYERRVLGQPRSNRGAGRRPLDDRRKPVRPERHPGRIDARSEILLALTGGDGDEQRRTRDDVAQCGCVDESLQPDLAELGAEHPEALEDVRHSAYAAPRCHRRADGVPQTEDVRHVGPRKPFQDYRNGGSEADPAIADRGCRIHDRGSGVELDARSIRAGPTRRPQRRRDDVDGPARFDKARRERSHHRDRTSERRCRPVGRRRDEQAKGGVQRSRHATGR